MPSRYSVVVSSTDSFSDTWKPFFDLMRAYWTPAADVPIYLNSEHLGHSVDNLDIRNTRIGRFFPGRHPTWSESIGAALSLIETDYVLYVQDDYFLYAPVRGDVIEEAIDAMRVFGLAHVRLLDGTSDVVPGPHPMLETITRRSRYYLSLQAGLWHRQALARLLRPHETPWEFELVGSHRARVRRVQLSRVRRDMFHDMANRVFPYEPTGIVKGRWERRIVEPLFQAHGLNVNFAVRGFTDADTPRAAPPKLTTLAKGLRRIRSLF